MTDTILLSTLNSTNAEVRYLDSPMVAYSQIVQQPIGVLDKTLNIGIVGAGLAGITCAYECLRMRKPDAPDNVNISVDLYENDPEHFLNSSDSKKAGRIFGFKVGPDVYELGAMRIPKKAVLTWNYTSRITERQAQSLEVELFPNPGFVPSAFVFDNTRVCYDKDTTTNSELNFVKSLVKKVKNLMMGNEEDKVTSLFPIGDHQPYQVSKLLSGNIKPDTSSTQSLCFKNLPAMWDAFKKANDKLSLRGAVTEIIHKCHQLEILPKLPPNAAMVTEDNTVRIAYYVRLIGHLGFGSGGFCTMYSMSFVDYMREAVWNDDTDYLLPFDSNSDLPKGILALAEQSCLGVKGKRIETIRAEVTDVFHSAADKAKVVYKMPNYYEEEIYVSGVKERVVRCNHSYNVKEYDYVIITVPPKQLSEILASSMSLKTPTKIDLPDKGIFSCNARSPFLPGPGPYANTMWPSLLSEIYLVAASKSFITVSKDKWCKYAPQVVNKEGTQEPVRSIIFENGLGVLYTFPSVDEDKLVVLLSYSWEEESRYIQSLTSANPSSSLALDRVISIAKHANLDFLDKLLKEHNDADLRPYSYSWSSAKSVGAFKAGRPGDVYINNVYSNIYKYVIYEGHCITLAGEPYARMGGWMESALISSINAVAGIAKSMSMKHLSCTVSDKTDQLFACSGHADLTPLVPTTSAVTTTESEISDKRQTTPGDPEEELLKLYLDNVSPDTATTKLGNNKVEPSDGGEHTI